MKTAQETLDPGDWDAMEQPGIQMVSDMMHNLSTVRERKAWQQPPENVKKYFQQQAPAEGDAIENIYADFKSNILPYPTGNIHPRFWGWVMGNGSPLAMLADMLASGINLNQGGGNQVGGLVETQVIEWFKKLFHFPEEASGLIVSGAALSSYTTLYGKYSLRGANTNHRTVKNDFDILIDTVHELERKLEKENDRTASYK